jgi:uncharacterized damage-inducible protein DinB
MREPGRNVLEPLPGFRSAEAALFIAELDDLGARLTADLRSCSTEELAWQPAPGTNTIGMLLAHLAIVEVFWTRLVLEDRPMPFEIEDVLGIGMVGDGMPLAADAPPPADLVQRPLGWFDELLERGRAHVRRHSVPLTDADLVREIAREHPDPVTRKGRDGRIVTPRWMLYHLVEHLGCHYGQILLLRHLYGSTAAGRPTT